MVHLFLYYSNSLSGDIQTIHLQSDITQGILKCKLFKELLWTNQSLVSVPVF